MTRPSIGVLVCAWLTFAAAARGGTIWQFTHEASGEGSARLFGGGSVVSESDATTSLDDPNMEFSPFDLTRPGVDGASVSTIGRSDIRPFSDRLVLNAGFATSYLASSRLGADRPGGEAEGWMSSVVEFVMPVDTLDWRVVFDITRGSGFTGMGSLLIENITRSEILVDESSSQTMFFTLDGILSGRAGDVIRVSIAGSASGSVPRGVSSHGGFDLFYQQVFTIPEPTTVALLGLGALFVFKRRRQITSGHHHESFHGRVGRGCTYSG